MAILLNLVKIASVLQFTPYGQGAARRKVKQVLYGADHSDSRSYIALTQSTCNLLHPLQGIIFGQTQRFLKCHVCKIIHVLVGSMGP